jgi:CRP-like cAMP-binding protein
MEKLIAFLNAIFPLSLELEAELVKILESKLFKRCEYLLKAGQIARFVYFIEKGLVRCYYRLGDRNISAWFMKEGDVIISVNSFFGQIPSAEYMQALEETTVHYISYSQLESLYKEFVIFNIHGRKLLTHYYRLSEKRAVSMRSLRAKDRYKWLLENDPDLLQRVPRKYLATYLGVTESTLSHTSLPSK